MKLGPQKLFSFLSLFLESVTFPSLSRSSMQYHVNRTQFFLIYGFWGCLASASRCRYSTCYPELGYVGEWR